MNRDKSYSEEVKYVENLFNQYSKIPVKRILDLGSGTGGHGKVFSKKGYNVTGIEKSYEMVSIANQHKSKNFKSINSDLTNFNLNTKYDLIISLFHVLNYLNSNNELMLAFKNISMHLKKGGLFIFDVWYSPAVYMQKPEIRKREFIIDDYCITRVAKPSFEINENIVNVNFDFFIKNLTY